MTAPHELTVRRSGRACPAERRAAFKLIDCNRKRAPERPCIADVFSFILPKVELTLSQNVDSWDFECRAMGVTTWQRNEAFRLLDQHRDDPRFMQLVCAISRRQWILRALEEALSQERRFVVAMMLEHYPAAGRRLMKTMQRKDGPICRIHRRKRKGGK